MEEEESRITWLATPAAKEGASSFFSLSLCDAAKMASHLNVRLSFAFGEGAN